MSVVFIGTLNQLETPTDVVIKPAVSGKRVSHRPIARRILTQQLWFHTFIKTTTHGRKRSILSRADICFSDFDIKASCRALVLSNIHLF